MVVSKEQYKERLKQFNSTEKYKNELDFLCRLMNPRPGEKILDYGCGIGTAVMHIRENYGVACYGYDVVNYAQNDESIFRTEFFFKFDKVFFMHSIAHIPNIEQKLIYLKELLAPEARIYVVTPNKMWLDNIGTPSTYIPDGTVINHLTSLNLIELFVHAGYKNISPSQFGGYLNGVNERLFLEASL
jgi:2-polyprenyl-3-methyl-5-hydroxy-6-metoxy-1,4-benzoquinol methylase